MYSDTLVLNFSEFFLSCFPCHFCQYGMVQIVPEKCLKFSYLLLEKVLWKVMKLQSCYAVFMQPPYRTLSAFTVFLLMLNWKKNFLLLGITFRGHAKEKAKQQPATWMVFLTWKKNTLKNLACRAGVFGCRNTRLFKRSLEGRHFEYTAVRLVGEGRVRGVEEREKTPYFSPPYPIPPSFLNPSSSPSESFLGSPQPSVSFITQDGGNSYPVSYPLKIRLLCRLA